MKEFEVKYLPETHIMILSSDDHMWTELDVRPEEAVEAFDNLIHKAEKHLKPATVHYVTEPSDYNTMITYIGDAEDKPEWIVLDIPAKVKSGHQLQTFKAYCKRILGKSVELHLVSDLKDKYSLEP